MANIYFFFETLYSSPFHFFFFYLHLTQSHSTSIVTLTISIFLVNIFINLLPLFHFPGSSVSNIVFFRRSHYWTNSNLPTHCHVSSVSLQYKCPPLDQIYPFPLQSVSQVRCHLAPKDGAPQTVETTGVYYKRNIYIDEVSIIKKQVLLYLIIFHPYFIIILFNYTLTTSYSSSLTGSEDNIFII